MASLSFDELLQKWEDARSRGQALTPEELCRDSPERLGEIKRKIAALAGIDEMLYLRRSAGESELRSPSTVDDVETPAPAEAAAEATTSRYQVEHSHAKGGLGEVFRAQDRVLDRPVALKRIREDKAGIEGHRQRFLREAAITGQLQHPGVVPIYDLSIDADGQASYAMRFIEGETLEAAIKRFHSITPALQKMGFDSLEFRRLLQRFVSVCNTIGYAHSKGVIHRDLKPANVMLGDYDETLVVDWGLAKRFSASDPAGSTRDSPTDSLEPADDGATRTGNVVGTPAYMSPEQADGRVRDVGPASDIFALGAILYALLAGRAPYPGRNAVTVLNLARERKCPPPRQLNRRVPAALEEVCVKAMALKREDRYGSALDLAKEVERWLADEPVTAWREPLGLRLRRWLRKHSRLVAGFAAASVVGLAALGVVAWQREQARLAVAIKEGETAKERDIAREQKRRTRAALDTMVSPEMIERLAMQKELTKGQREFFQTALRYYHEFAAEAPTDEEGRRLEADAYCRVGSLLQALGQNEEAISAYRMALPILEKLAADFAALTEFRVVLARTHHNLGNLLCDLGQQRTADSELIAARIIFTKLANDFPAEPEYRSDVAASYISRGRLLFDLGQRKEAETAFRAALAIRARLAAEFPAVAEYRRNVADSHDRLGVALAGLGQEPSAEAELRVAKAIYSQLVADFPAESDYRVELANNNNHLGSLLLKFGQSSAAEAEYRAALVTRGKLVSDFPALPGLRSALASSYNNLGELFRDLGQRPAAEAEYRAALALFEKLAADFPAEPKYRSDVAGSHQNLGVLFRDLAQWPAAEAEFMTALAIRAKLTVDFPTVPAYRSDLATCHNDLGALFGCTRNWSAAEFECKAALSISARLADDFPAIPQYRSELAESRNMLGLLLRDLGQASEAEAEFRAAIAIQAKQADGHPEVPNYRDSLANSHNNLGILLREMGQQSAAEAEHRAALAIREKLAADFPGVPGYTINLAGSYCNFADIFFADHKFAVALAWHHKAVAALDPIVAAEPRQANGRRFLRNAHSGKASDLIQLNRYAVALSECDAALKFDDGTARLGIRHKRAGCLAFLRQFADSVRETCEIAADSAADAGVVYDCACSVSLTSAARNNPAADAHAARAVDLLRQAIAKGFNDIPHLLADDDLAPLRGRADYTDLLWDLADTPVAPAKP